MPGTNQTYLVYKKVINQNKTLRIKRLQSALKNSTATNQIKHIVRNAELGLFSYSVSHIVSGNLQHL